MVKCQSCGTENPDGQRFCGDCGNKIIESIPEQTEASPLKSPKVGLYKRHKKFFTVVIAIIIVITIILTTIAIYISVYGGPPWEPTYSAELTVKVYYTQWGGSGGSKSFDTYIDDSFRRSDSVNATLWSYIYNTWTYTVTWKGATYHDCIVDVVTDRGHHMVNVFLRDGESDSIRVNIT